MIEHLPTAQPQSVLELKPNFNVVYRGKMFEIVHWEGKPGVMFEAAVRAPGVRLLIETEKNGMKALLMTKEVRREADGVDYRLPGGKVFDSLTELDAHRESGQDIAPAAKAAAEKEGREEAGVRAGDFVPAGVSKAGASVEWDLHYFEVKNAVVGEQQLEEHEKGDIETVVLSAEEIFEKLSLGEIQEGRSAEKLWIWLKKNSFITFAK
jgi:8-oxo-dGTP pyrophosphatase MutT (NUDIX family)